MIMSDLIPYDPHHRDQQPSVPHDGFPPDIIEPDAGEHTANQAQPVSITINTADGAYRQRLLPPDIEAFERTLIDQIEKAEAYEREMDGKFLGYFGWDAFTVLIPGLNALLNLWAAMVLLGVAGRVRSPLGTRLNIILLTAIDMAIGLFPVVGDAVDIVWRSTAWSADRVASFAKDKLFFLERARQHAAAQGGYTETDIEAIRDHLFRNGANIWMTRLPLLVVGGLFVLWIASGLIG
jgi:hypothetical protein